MMDLTAQDQETHGRFVMFRKFPKMLLAVLLIIRAIPALSQTAPGATEGTWPLVVGVGYSNFHTDWSGRLSGPSFWADWTFNRLPGIWHGVGVELVGRDLNFDRTGGDPKLRMDTISGGPIYTWRRDRRIRPYGKFLFGYGSIDFTAVPGYSHDTRTVYTPGGGVDYRFWKNLSVRGDYEYQFWTDFFSHHALNPQGLTVGVDYDFGHSRRFVGLTPASPR
jgi:opacity protein-like surface antigen